MATSGRKNPASQRTSTRSTRTALAERSPFHLTTPIVLGIFILVTLIFFFPLIIGNAWLWEDFTKFTYPNEVYAARNFMAGNLPFWNPYSFNGMPFLADLQIGYFYPPNQLMYLLSGGELSAWLAQIFVVLHYLVAMIGMWKLAKGLGIGEWGSVFAGIAYALCGMMVVHMIHPNMIHHLAWFPLIVYLFYRGVDERSWFYSLLSGITLGVALLSGHPQSALYIVFFLFALTIFLVVRDVRSDDTARKRTLLPGLLAAALPIVVGVGMFAIQLLQSQELAALSERADFTYKDALEGSMGFGQLLTLVVPKYFGVITGSTMTAPGELPFWYRPEPYYFWETVVYIGVVTLLLAVIGLLSRRLGALGWFLAGMGLLGLLYALGDNFLVHPLLARLPLFDTFRIPTRMAIYLAFAGALLGGVGLERVVRGGENSDRLAKVGLITGGLIAAIGLLTVMGIWNGFLQPPKEVAGSLNGTGAIALLVGGAATLVCWASLKGKMAPTVSAVVLLALLVIDLGAFGMGQNNSPDNPETDTYRPNDEQFSTLKAVPPEKIFRVKMRGESGMLMPQNQGPYSGILLYEGYNPLRLGRRVPPAASLETSYDLLNITYDLKSDSAAGREGLVERATALPHARMVYNVKVATPETSSDAMKSTDLKTTVVLEESPAVQPDGSGSGEARITRYDPGEIEVAVTTDKPGILVLSEIWYPSWEVTVDGASTALLVADYSLRGVAIPAGTHTVRMSFRSSAFSTGLWITVATFAASLAGVILLGMKKKNQDGAESREKGHNSANS